MNEIGNRIKYLREKFGLNKTEMAKRIGVDRTTIGRYEKGEIFPNLDVLLNIKDKFNVSLDWLAGADTEEQDYSKIIEECKKADITPEKLGAIIKVLKS